MHVPGPLSTSINIRSAGFSHVPFSIFRTPVEAGPARSRRASKYFYRERLALKHHPVNSCQNHRSTHAPQSRCRIATHPRNRLFRRQCQLLLATAVAKLRSSLPWPPCKGQIHAQISDSLSGGSSTRKTLGEFTCSI